MYTSSLDKRSFGSETKSNKKFPFHHISSLLVFVKIWNCSKHNSKTDRIEQNNNPKQNNTHVPRPKITCQVIPIRTVPVLQPYITSNQFIEFKKKKETHPDYPPYNNSPFLHF